MCACPSVSQDHRLAGRGSSTELDCSLMPCNIKRLNIIRPQFMPASPSNQMVDRGNADYLHRKLRMLSNSKTTVSHLKISKRLSMRSSSTATVKRLGPAGHIPLKEVIDLVIQDKTSPYLLGNKTMSLEQSKTMMHASNCKQSNKEAVLLSETGLVSTICSMPIPVDRDNATPAVAAGDRIVVGSNKPQWQEAQGIPAQAPRISKPPNFKGTVSRTPITPTSACIVGASRSVSSENTQSLVVENPGKKREVSLVAQTPISLEIEQFISDGSADRSPQTGWRSDTDGLLWRKPHNSFTPKETIRRRPVSAGKFISYLRDAQEGNNPEFEDFKKLVAHVPENQMSRLILNHPESINELPKYFKLDSNLAGFSSIMGSALLNKSRCKSILVKSNSVSKRSCGVGQQSMNCPNNSTQKKVCFNPYKMVLCFASPRN
jgi:hypothetical protein